MQQTSIAAKLFAHALRPDGLFSTRLARDGIRSGIERVCFVVDCIRIAVRRIRLGEARIRMVIRRIRMAVTCRFPGVAADSRPLPAHKVNDGVDMINVLVSGRCEPVTCSPLPAGRMPYAACSLSVPANGRSLAVSNPIVDVDDRVSVASISR